MKVSHLHSNTQRLTAHPTTPEYRSPAPLAAQTRKAGVIDYDIPPFLGTTDDHPTEERSRDQATSAGTAIHSTIALNTDSSA